MHRYMRRAPNIKPAKTSLFFKISDILKLNKLFVVNGPLAGSSVRTREGTYETIELPCPGKTFI